MDFVNKLLLFTRKTLEEVKLDSSISQIENCLMGNRDLDFIDEQI